MSVAAVEAVGFLNPGHSDLRDILHRGYREYRGYRGNSRVVNRVLHLTLTWESMIFILHLTLTSVPERSNLDLCTCESLIFGLPLTSTSLKTQPRAG